MGDRSRSDGFRHHLGASGRCWASLTSSEGYRADTIRAGKNGQRPFPRVQSVEKKRIYAATATLTIKQHR
jgi:hypothetical protein